MTTSVERISGSLRIPSRLAWVLVAAGVLGVAALAALATRFGVLPIAVGAVLLGVMAVVGFRWPMVPLIAFVALIPIEEVVVIGGFGTFSRVAGLLFATMYALPRLGSLRFGAIPLAGWGYVAWALASVTWAMSPAVAGAALSTLVQLFVIALLIADYVVRTPAIVRPILWAYSLSAVATALIGVATYVGSGVGTERSVAIHGQDPAQFAAVLLPALVFGFYELLDGQRRALGAAIAVITTAAVVVSGTRGAWVACAVVILFVVLPQLSPRRRVVAIVATAALVAMTYQIPGIAELVASRTDNAISSGGAGRTDIWTVGRTIYGSSPLAGVGYSNFPVAFTMEVIRAAGVSWEWFNRIGTGSHNLVVATLSELGTVGMALLALFLGPLVIRRGWGPDAATIQAALVSLLTVSLFLDILANRKQVWLVIGIAAGLAFLAHKERRAAAASGLLSDPVEPLESDPGSPVGTASVRPLA